MIHSLEDKNKKELIEIVKIQFEEYQQASKRIAELKECLQEHLKASTSVYSTSRELGEAETKTIALLEKLEEQGK